MLAGEKLLLTFALFYRNHEKYALNDRYPYIYPAKYFCVSKAFNRIMYKIYIFVIIIHIKREKQLYIIEKINAIIL